MAYLNVYRTEKKGTGRYLSALISDPSSAGADCIHKCVTSVLIPPGGWAQVLELASNRPSTNAASILSPRSEDDRWRSEFSDLLARVRDGLPLDRSPSFKAMVAKVTSSRRIEEDPETWARRLAQDVGKLAD